MMSINRVIEPRSIAVVGASSDPDKRGHQILASLKNKRYEYPIYPVNPRGGEILGLPVISSLEEMPEQVDLVVISRPAASVVDVIRQCAAKDIGGVVILAHGFTEAGPEGAQLQSQLSAVLAETQVRAVGPNTSGIINFTLGADLVGLTQAVGSGYLSVITQSGNMLLSLLADSQRYGLSGLDVYVGLGNQVDISYAELLFVLAERTQTKVIAIHSEGFRNGRALLLAAAKTSRVKPIVLLRGGRSEAGRRSALSHTGSVAGSDQVTESVLRQCGVTLVDRLDELALVAGTLASTPLPPKGSGVAVLTDGGGHGTVAVDHLVRSGMRLARLSAHTQQQLQHLLTEKAYVQNPIDVASATDASPQLFAQCVELLVKDADVGLILIVGLLGGYYLRFPTYDKTDEHSACEAIALTSREAQTPVIVHSCYESMQAEPLAAFRSLEVTVVDSIEHGVRCAQALFDRSDWLASAAQRACFTRANINGGPGAGSAVIIQEPQARDLLSQYGLDTGLWGLATSPAAAYEQVRRFGKACAFKAVVKGVTHKSDHGGVILGVTADGAMAAYKEIANNFNNGAGQSPLSGVVVAPMEDAGTELFVAVINDDIYGPVLAFGSGGIAIDALGDMAFRALPATSLEIEEMIRETRISRLLFGYRDMPVTQMSVLVELLQKISSCAMQLIRKHQLYELEFNPIILNTSGLAIVDVRMTCHS